MGDTPRQENERPAALSPERHSGVVTLLFTDVVGSTALKQQLGDKAGLELLQRHHDLLRNALLRFAAAHEIKTAGDSFFLSFRTPSAAVSFALLLQNWLCRFNAECATPVQDRVGIHLGEVTIEGGERSADLHGLSVDLCARVMSLAQAGQILMTRPVFDNARQSLKGEEIEGVGGLEWLNHGRFELKGVEGPVEICEVQATGVAAPSPPTTSEKARRVEAVEGEAVLGWRPAVGSLVPNTQWLLEQKLGEGGFGEVWLGRHRVMKERRVFKFCFRADRVRSLKREMTLFRLIKERIGDHPNIVALREVYFEQPPYYVEEEYVAGQDLARWCAAQGGADKVPLKTKLDIVAQIADALQAAHDAGVIHRDVKPANILVSNARSALSTFNSQASTDSEPSSRKAQLLVKLADFGIGQVVSQEALAGVTRAGFTQTIVAGSPDSKTGTHLYMAPEIFAGRPATTRSDIYSLGVVLFQLLEGNFAQPLTTDWVKRLSDPLLREDLEHCFAGDPDERFSGAAQLSKALRALPERRAEWERRQAERFALERAAYRRGIVRTAAVAILILVGVTALALYGFTQARRARMEAQRADLNARNEASQRELAERSVYAADMILAFQSLEAGNFGYARELIRKHLPMPGARDLRGWEWRYLWQQCHADPAVTLASDSRSYFTAAAFFPDGQTVAAASKDKTVKLWDLQSRHLIDTLPHSDKVQGLAVSSDGKLLVSGCEDGTIRLWDAATKRLIFSMTNAPQVSALVFSTDSKLIAWIDARRAVVWDVAARRELFGYDSDFALGAWGKTGLALSPDGRYLAFGSENNQVEVWDWANKSRKGSLRGHEARVLTLSFSPDGKTLVSGDAKSIVKIWESSTLQEVFTLTNHATSDSLAAHGMPWWVGSSAFSPDGRTLALASADQTVTLRSTETWEVITTLIGHDFEVWSVAYSPDGRKLITASKDNTIKIWDAAVRAKRDVPKIAQGTDFWVFSPNGTTLLRSYTNQTVTVTDIATLRETELPLSTPTNLARLAIANDKRLVALGCRDGSVKLIDLARAGAGSEFNRSAPVEYLEFSPDAKTLAVVWQTYDPGSNPRVELWDTAAVRCVRELQARQEPVSCKKFSPDNRWFAVGYGDTTVEFWDLVTGSKTTVPSAQNEGIFDVAFATGGHILASASFDIHLKLWDVATGKERARMGGQLTGFQTVTFSADDRRLAAGSAEGSVTIWDISNPQPLEVGKLKGHTEPVWNVMLLPDGNTLVSTSKNGVRVWRAPSWAEIEATEKGIAGPQKDL